MRQIGFGASLIAMAALLTGCATAPRTTSLLEQARAEYAAAQGNADVVRYAPLELKQAGDALQRAGVAAAERGSPEDIDKLAYLARQKTALAREVAQTRTAEASIAAAVQERERMRLEQRTLEANRARARAEQSAQAASAASAQAAAAQRQAQLAQQQAAEAERTRQQAEAQAAEALRSRQEAQAQAARLQSELAELSARQTARGTIVTLGDFLFATGRAELSENGMRKVRKLADVLSEHGEVNVQVEGYTDSVGNEAYNQELSERRALAVRDALQRLGIDPRRVAVKGYGEEYPVAPNDTAQNRQLNRRVEIVLSDSSGRVSQR
jgi:outer membrane protein OmpA-like peptidoglycan-associated protein